MTFLLDPRAGSKELEPHLRSIGVPVTMEQLVAGDIAFTGRGPGERAVSVGVEYKTLSDVLACIMSGRFADVQLPGMQQAYESAWLLVEGLWKPGEAGELLVKVGNQWKSPPWSRKLWRYVDVQHWFNTMGIIGGINIARTGSKGESAFWLKSLFTWWTAKQWADHNSHRQLKSPAIDNPFHRSVPVVERVAACLPGVGPKRATAVAEYFGSVLALASADVEAWEGVEGVGKTTAKKVHAAIRGEE